MCGSSEDSPDPIRVQKPPPIQPPEQAPVRVAPELIEKRRETNRQRRAVQGGSGNAENLGVLETTESKLI